MDDLGAPIAYLALADGTPVFDKHGRRIGVVEHVMAEEDLDVFVGLIVHTRPLPGRHLFADADQVERLYERGVVLSVDEDDLHDPEPRQGASRGGPRATSSGRLESPLEARLRRAWDWISGHP
jgi:hypothetical protein